MDDLSLSSLLLHADDSYHSDAAVSAPISLSTTFRFPEKPDEVPREGDDPAVFNPFKPDFHIYSRYSQPTLVRAEALVSAACRGFAILYPSGLSAVMAALMHYKPKVIAIGKGYHGTHETIGVFKSLCPDVTVIGLDDEYTSPDTLCWLETPVNPTGESLDVSHYAEKVHKLGGKLAVDSTLAPPPLQNPFEQGADMVHHSGTKYFNGHSDALMGILAVKTEDERKKLWHVRTYAGNVPGSLEVWLLMRSIRTLTVRVQKQAETATALAAWLKEGDFPNCSKDILSNVWHSSFQANADLYGSQINSGPACFAFAFQNPEHAKRIGSMTKLFIPATSLGGVESLLERRLNSDPTADPRLIRLSIGLEDLKDLQADLLQAFQQLSQ